MTLSFIIPCYKVEQYIQTCLDSIFALETVHAGFVADTDMDFELICINDASPDNTSKILFQNQQIHSNIQIIDLKENIGFGGARNLGLSVAHGEYIWFVDSDDTIDTTHVADMLKQSISNGLDVLAFNHKDLDHEGHIYRTYKLFSDTPILDGVTFIKSVFGINLGRYLGYVWRFIYRKQYLINQQIVFPVDRCWEDTRYMPQAMMRAARIQSSSCYAYEYWHHTTSICSVFSTTYPGKLLFEFAFLAGIDILQLSDETDDKILKKILHNIAINDYFNCFPVQLCKETYRERSIFYQMLVSEYYTVVRPVLVYLKPLQRILVTPYLGRLVAEILAIFYKLTHKR